MPAWAAQELAKIGRLTMREVILAGLVVLFLAVLLVIGAPRLLAIG